MNKDVTLPAEDFEVVFQKLEKTIKKKGNLWCKLDQIQETLKKNADKVALKSDPEKK